MITGRKANFKSKEPERSLAIGGDECLGEVRRGEACHRRGIRKQPIKPFQPAPCLIAQSQLCSNNFYTETPYVKIDGKPVDSPVWIDLQTAYYYVSHQKGE